MDIQKTINTSSKQQEAIRTLTVRINQPESDDRCDSCGKPISELEPFSLEWNPKAGAFDAVYLWKIYRPMLPHIEEAERIFNEFHWEGETEEDRLKADEKLLEKYGKEKADKVSFAIQASRSVDKCWDCRDCLGLGEKEYFEICARQYEIEKQKQESKK